MNAATIVAAVGNTPDFQCVWTDSEEGTKVPADLYDIITGAALEELDITISDIDYLSVEVVNTPECITLYCHASNGYGWEGHEGHEEDEKTDYNTRMDIMKCNKDT